MRKLLNFYKICYCYILLVFIEVFLLLFVLYGAFFFLFVDMKKYETVMAKFSNDICKILEDKIDEIIQDEFDILNEGIGCGCRVKNVNWYKEILITIFVIFLLLMFIVLKIL